MWRGASRLMSRAPGRQRGYTYVGLLILLAIMGLASALTVTAGAQMQQRSNEEELLFIGSEFALAFRSYFESTPPGQRPYPERLEELLRDPRHAGVKRHLRTIYFDPITGKQEWGLVPAPGDNGIMGVHSLSRKAPLKTAGFDKTFEALADKTTYSEWIFAFTPPASGQQTPFPGVIPSPPPEGATPIP
jgi:type II secretory pathway pseudopilin PulG